jgi:hypothetical protein
VVIKDTIEKAELLRKEVLGRFLAEDDLQGFDPEDFNLEDYARVTPLLWKQGISIEEVERYTISISSTLLGTDRVTVRLLKAC